MTEHFAVFHSHIFKEKIVSSDPELYYVVCEGLSESNYIKMLNRFLENNDYNLVFKAEPVKCGHYDAVEKKYLNEYGENNKNQANIIIWVDYDTYKRNDKEDGDSYKGKPKDIPDFLFSKMNFEDFLVLHREDEAVNKWDEICRENEHDKKPMKSEKYMQLIQKIFPRYKKRDIPIEITEESLANLFRHNKGGSIFSETNEFRTFVSFLEEKIQESPCL